MIKTTMAEAVRERPKAAKSKPKKNKVKKEAADAQETVPVAAPEAQDEDAAHSEDTALQMCSVLPEKSCHRESASGPEASDSLHAGDLEMDSGEDISCPDLAGLASQLEEHLDLQDDKAAAGVQSGGEPASSQDTPAAETDQDALNTEAEVKSVPTADLHLEESVNENLTHTCELSQGEPASSQDMLETETDNNALNAEPEVKSVPTADLLHLEESVEENVTPPCEIWQRGAAESDMVADVHILDDGKEQGMSNSVATVGEQASSSPAVSEVPDTASSTVTGASAPPSSLESSKSRPEFLGELTAPAPVPPPLAPQATAPLEPLAPPTAPPACVTTSTEVKSGATERTSQTESSLYPKVPLLESPVESKFQPMTVEQLQQLYYNPELQNNEKFVDEFVQREEKKTSHEFHEIVMNYFRSRKNLLSVEEDLKLLRQNYEQILTEMWVVHERNIPVEGHCADGSRVSKTHTVEQCELNTDALSSLKSTLQSIRSEMQGDLALFAYSSQMSRLQVESYLHLLFSSSQLLRDMPKSAPVTATDYTQEDQLPQVEKLRECVSVLFGFHRKPTKDKEFIENIRKWTDRLVAALLRLASYRDHLFLLNHVLRAPAGVGQWACGYIQIPEPASLALQTTLGSPVLDHAVTCLATILLPVKAREEFMCQMKLNVTEQSLQMEQAWTLVDSDGEEDEDPSQAWLYLHENDMVGILQQLPLQAIFTHLLQAPVDDSGSVHYDIRRCTEPSMMKLFAFCTTWISLLGVGLNTFSMARYKQLNKRLGRLIRDTIVYVSDHWLNFKTYYSPLASASSIDHLQLEFDQLFMRATYAILTAQKLGSWQFMANMPFTSLSSDSIWRLLWLLQQVHGQPVNFHTLPPVEKCREDMKDIESRRQLADTLQTLPASESIYLLTTFANMATARPLEEDEFIECITLQVFEIAFICDHTRDFCSNTGRALLSSIIQKHPMALSMLLRRVQGVMAELGKMSLYLFSKLPASIWIPHDPDMLLLRQWLLNNDLDTPENQLARVVIDRMNWGLFTETGKFVLDIRLHRQVALLLVESYVKFISDRRASFFIIEGMKQMASYAYTSQGSREQQFNNWVWSITLRLKLHREAAILHSRAAESHPFQAPSLEQEQWLLPLASAARAKNPLACFLVLSMTDVGHDTSLFISVGLDMLLTLTQCSQYSAVIHVLSCVTPQFISTPQYLLENETFQKILQMVLSADESVLKTTKMAMGAEFKAGTVTQQLAQMIQAMISARLEHNQALPILVFWIQAVFKVARFLTDMNCCYVLDHVVRWGHLQKGAKDRMDEIFRQYHKQLQAESKSRGSFLTWVGGGSASPPSLMERSSLPEFGWLATQILNVEDSLDQESGVWSALQHELLANPTLSLDTALKNVMTRLKPDYPRTVGRLCLYRWAQQALDMPITHPMVPLVWQKFFTLFLGRCTHQGQMPKRASVGERFFESMTMSSMLKKLKKKLAEAADYHMKYEPQENPTKMEDPPSETSTPSHGGSESDTPMPSPLTEENPQYFSSKEFHNQLARLYQTFLLWLDEPRLHGADLYLPALPPQYEAARLMHIFVPGNNPWLEFVDFEGAQYDISVFAAEWRTLVSGQPQFGSQSPAHQRGVIPPEQKTATERILSRLQRYKSPECPPSVQPVTPPVPDISPMLMTDKMAAIHLLDADLAVLTEFTKFFSTRAAQQCAVDGAFLDLIPSQFSNATRIAKVLIECRRVNPFHKCSGPAVISLKVDEREVNSVVQRKMDENRAEYKQLIIESVLPPPQNVCIAAVHVENAITLLIKLSQQTCDQDRRRVLCDVACTLFFHLTVQVCEETNFYPPTKQFFASCVEILGQEFVSRSPSETPLLMQFCLDNPVLAGMVAPHFTPSNAPQNFLSMYEKLITALQQQNLNLVFMLLTKFDVQAWLEETRPNADDRKRFLEILGSALMSCGAEPSADSKLVFDLFLSHLRFVLKHQFPANLSPVLILLLQGSSNEALHTRCWEMFLMECCAWQQDVQGCPVPRAFSVSTVQACNSLPLSIQLLEETLKMLATYFNHQRRSQQDLISFGLYPRWGRYVPYIALLLGLLSRSYVAKVLVAADGQNPSREIQLVWIQQLNAWQAWMEPLPCNVPPAHGASVVEMMEPWTEGDTVVAVSMVESFKSTLMFTHTTLANTAPQFSSCVFSLLLMHCTVKLSHRSTPPHVTDVLVGEFSQLPWEQLKPDLQLLETMTYLKERCAPSCFQLIGHVLPKVGWSEVITSFRAHHDPQVSHRLVAALLILLVQCYGDPYVRELPEVAQLLSSAETLDWTGLTVEAFRTASFWFVQVCQPVWVLAQRSSVPALGFRLMKTAAQFTAAASPAWTGEMSVKRLTYVHCVTQQLCQVTYLSSADLEVLSTVLVNLLSEVEAVESAVPDRRCQEEESMDLLKEILSLLNNSNPDGPSHTVVLQTLQQWLHSSPHSILLTPCIKASSRCLASLSHMVQVIETCIHVYFTAFTKDKETESDPAAQPAVSGWGHILAVFQVPELNADQYIKEALNSGSFLLLYTVLLHKRPLCQAGKDEARLLEDILDWTAHAAPSADNEAKLLLWWLEFCHMWLHQLDSGASVPLCIVTVQRLVVLLHQLGEDRSSAGFLGVIGLGKRSQLSPQFRLTVRSMAAFLSSQVLSETTLRFQPTSPLSDLPMAKQCRLALSSLRNNKLYAPLKDTVENMIGFVHRTDHTARSVLDLIKELCVGLYSDCNYLKTTVLQDGV
ncbi:ectopic P granules protein 5 homolog [Babylonia areolata]|uniref:ectopic P granules protein 5 homolog n=1 Tax=Babylonia areolata TaxID=304850 RepID=UPI003FD47512